MSTAIQEFCRSSLKLRDLTQEEKETRAPLNQQRTDLKKRLHEEMESHGVECVHLHGDGKFKFARFKKTYSSRVITGDMLRTAAEAVTSQQLTKAGSTALPWPEAVTKATMDNLKELRTTESNKVVLCNDKPRQVEDIPACSAEVQNITENIVTVQRELQNVSRRYSDTKKDLQATKKQASIQVVEYFREHNASSQPLQLSYNGIRKRYFLQRTTRTKKKAVSVSEVKQMVTSAAAQTFGELDDATAEDIMSNLVPFADRITSQYDVHRAPEVSETVVLKRASEKEDSQDLLEPPEPLEPLEPLAEESSGERE